MVRAMVTRVCSIVAVFTLWPDQRSIVLWRPLASFPPLVSFASLASLLPSFAWVRLREYEAREMNKLKLASLYAVGVSARLQCHASGDLPDKVGHLEGLKP